MSLPAGWQVVRSSKPFESGQSWVFQVKRGGDTAVYALKRLKNPDRRQRFAREVKEMIRLHEQGLALPPVIKHDLGIERPYFVMPWYERGSLEAKVEDGTYVERTLEGLDLLIHIARELEKLHNAGVAHRDLKPANILLGDNGPLLADFGLCLPIDHTDERLTETAEQIGSRFYIAPENESGINEDVDQRPADFYAFGKMAWVLLAGRRPFARELTGNPKLRLQAIRQDKRFAILDDLLDELMNFDPRARLVDWSIVIGELAAFQAVLQGAQTPSRPMNLDETLRLARRVGRLPELETAAQERQDEAKASQWINGHLIQSLFPLAARIQNELTELTDAANGAITFQVSTGGEELRRLVEVEPRFAFPEYIPSMITPNQTSGAPVLYTVQPVAEPKIPTLYLGLYIVRIRRQFWIMRVPVLAYPPGPLPGSMIDRYYRRIGLCRLGGRLRLTTPSNYAVRQWYCSWTWHIDTWQR